MREKTFSSETLATTNYQVVIVKRDYETVLLDTQTMVSKNMSDVDFVAWQIANFVIQMRTEGIPLDESTYEVIQDLPGAQFKPQKCSNFPIKKLVALDGDDYQYLRISFQVVSRVSKEEPDYAKQKTDALESIAGSIQKNGDIYDLCSDHGVHPIKSYDTKPTPTASIDKSTEAIPPVNKVNLKPENPQVSSVKPRGWNVQFHRQSQSAPKAPKADSPPAPKEKTRPYTSVNTWNLGLLQTLTATSQALKAPESSKTGPNLPLPEKEKEVDSHIESSSQPNSEQKPDPQSNPETEGATTSTQAVDLMDTTSKDDVPPDVEPEPTLASLDFRAAAITGSGTIYFQALGTEDQDLRWAFGDGIESAETLPSHAYEKDGTHSVRLFCGNRSVDKEFKVTRQGKRVSAPELIHLPRMNKMFKCLKRLREYLEMKSGIPHDNQLYARMRYFLDKAINIVQEPVEMTYFTDSDGFFAFRSRDLLIEIFDHLKGEADIETKSWLMQGYQLQAFTFLILAKHRPWDIQPDDPIDRLLRIITKQLNNLPVDLTYRGIRWLVNYLAPISEQRDQELLREQYRNVTDLLIPILRHGGRD